MAEPNRETTAKSLPTTPKSQPGSANAQGVASATRVRGKRVRWSIDAFTTVTPGVPVV
jgi:hypothetical protein